MSGEILEVSASSSPKFWVVFDFGGVILTSYDKQLYQTAMNEVVARTGLADAAAVKRRVYDGPEFQSAKVGKMTTHEMYSTIFGSYGVTDAADVERFRDAVRLVGRNVKPEFLEFVKRLKSRSDVGIAVLSNYESDLREVMQHLGIRDVFEPFIFSSYELQVAKPESACFVKTLQLLKTASTARWQSQEDQQQEAANEGGSSDDVAKVKSILTKGDCVVIFVDDKARNVEGAIAAGIPNSFVYTTIAQCLSDVERVIGTAQ